jgi:hypothetical protein
VVAGLAPGHRVLDVVGGARFASFEFGFNAQKARKAFCRSRSGCLNSTRRTR